MVSYHDNESCGREESTWTVRGWSLAIFYENGQLHSKGTYKDGKKEGPWVYYYNTGEVVRRATHKDGGKSIYD